MVLHSWGIMWVGIRPQICSTCPRATGVDAHHNQLNTFPALCFTSIFGTSHHSAYIICNVWLIKLNSTVYHLGLESTTNLKMELHALFDGTVMYLSCTQQALAVCPWMNHECKVTWEMQSIKIVERSIVSGTPYLPSTPILTSPF